MALPLGVGDGRTVAAGEERVSGPRSGDEKERGRDSLTSLADAAPGNCPWCAEKLVPSTVCLNADCTWSRSHSFPLPRNEDGVVLGQLNLMTRAAVRAGNNAIELSVEEAKAVLRHSIAQSQRISELERAALSLRPPTPGEKL